MDTEIALSKFLIWISKIEYTIRSSRASKMFHKNYQLNNPSNRSQFTAMNIMFSLGALCIMFLLYHLSTYTHREHVIASYNSPDVLNVTSDYFKSPDYLYRSSLYVTELGPPRHKGLVNSKDPVVIVYYAPWCGHCRHFVPAYNKLAQTINIDIANHNRESSLSHKLYKNVTFASVNCVDQKSICSDLGISAYPTVIVYHIKPLSGPAKRSRNYGTKKDPDSEIFSSKDDEIKVFIMSNYYLGPHFTIIPPSEEVLSIGTNSVNTPTTSTAAAVAAATDVTIRTSNSTVSQADNGVGAVASTTTTSSVVGVNANSMINSLSRIASPSQRLQDGLTSFDYLLLSELPSTMTADKARALFNFLQLLVVTLPDSYNSRAALYTEMSRVLKKFLDAGKSYFLRANAKEDKRLTVTMRELLTSANISSDSLAWQTCGLFVKPSNGALNEGGDSGLANRKVARKNRRNQRRRAKMERQEKRSGKSGNSTATGGENEEDGEEEEDPNRGGVTAETLNRDVGTGYTCGLWFLFHYITVTSSEHSNQITATAAMDGIYQLVAQFFSCDECRNHFIDHYTSCKFQRCDIKAENYDLLQLWLFHTHNYVTYGVVLEEHTDPPLSDTAISEYLWPNKHQPCKNCTTVIDYYYAKNDITPPVPLVARMKHAKKDGTPVVPVTAKSIQNNKILSFLKETYVV